MRFPSFSWLHCLQKGIGLVDFQVGVGMLWIVGFHLPLSHFIACSRRMTAQRGFTLIESLVAMGILGFIGVAFMSALYTNFNATDITDKSVIAENLSRAQLEYISNQDYFVPPSVPYLIPPGNDTGAYSVPPPGVTPPSEYTLTLEITQYCDGSGCYPINQIQKITAKILRQGEFVRKLSNLKTNR